MLREFVYDLILIVWLWIDVVGIVGVRDLLDRIFQGFVGILRIRCIANSLGALLM